MAVYGYSIAVTFSFESRELARSAAVIFAIAHIRGGGELGQTLARRGGGCDGKRNTFTDFIAAAEHLIARPLYDGGRPW